MLDLYRNIKSRRIELGLSQEELAKRVGYSGKSMIAKIEKGLVDLSQTKIMDFAKALETDAGDLMGWDDNAQKMSDRTLKYAELLSRLPEKKQEIIFSLIDEMKED